MGVASNNWLDRVLLLNSPHVPTPMLTDVQTPFLGSPFVHLTIETETWSGRLLAPCRGPEVFINAPRRASGPPAPRIQMEDPPRRVSLGETVGPDVHMCLFSVPFWIFPRTNSAAGCYAFEKLLSPSGPKVLKLAGVEENSVVCGQHTCTISAASTP